MGKYSVLGIPTSNFRNRDVNDAFSHILSISTLVPKRNMKHLNVNNHQMVLIYSKNFIQENGASAFCYH